jgi:hypothetical protein
MRPTTRSRKRLKSSRCNAKFKKKDGSTFNYPLNKLTEEDQATIKEAAEKAKEPAPGTP